MDFGLLKKYLKSDNENLNLYGIYIIKNYLTRNEQNNEKELEILLSQFNIDYLSCLINLLYKDNNKLSYVILWILINISYIDSNELLFISNKDIIIKISQFLGKNKRDKILTYRGLWLIRNITFNNKVKDMLLKYNIFEYFNEIYEKYCLDNKFIHNLFACIGNFTINPNKKYIKQYLLIIKLLKYQLNTSINVKYLNKYVNYLYNLTNLNSDEIFKEILKEEIYKNLINIYPFKIKNNKNDNIYIIEEENDNSSNNLKILILKILGKILYLDDNEELVIQNLINYGLINFLNKVIDTSDNNNKIIKNVSFCISNICTGNYDQINKLYDEQIFLKLVDKGNTIYEELKNNINLKSNEIKELQEAFREICYVFCLAIINSIYEKLLPLVKYQNSIIIIFIMEALNIFENKIELIELCLNSIYHLVRYDKNTEEFNAKIRVSEFNITFSEFMDRNGIKPILEILMNNKNEKINKMAEKIYDNIYCSTK